MRETELVCVNCPKGCKIKVKLDGNEVIAVEGYSCDKGLNYAKQEVVRPMRVLTSTVKIIGADSRVLPVITDGEIPLDIWEESMEAIRKMEVLAPVSVNEIIAPNFLETGINLVAGRSMKASSN